MGVIVTRISYRCQCWENTSFCFQMYCRAMLKLWVCFCVYSGRGCFLFLFVFVLKQLSLQVSQTRMLLKLSMWWSKVAHHSLTFFSLKVGPIFPSLESGVFCYCFDQESRITVILCLFHVQPFRELAASVSGFLSTESPGSSLTTLLERPIKRPETKQRESQLTPGFFSHLPRHWACE